MPNCRDIVTRALRKIGHIGRTENASDADLSMGMGALQSMYDEWAVGGAFGTLVDVYRDVDYTAVAGQRIRTTHAVTLPAYTDATAPSVDDYGFDRCDDGRPRNRSLIVVVNPTTGQHITNLWDAWRGQWIEIQGLAAADQAPLAELGSNGLVCSLACAVADDAGLAPTDDTRRAAAAFQRRLVNRHDGEREPTRAEFF